jgi:hypothetical protein
MPKVHGRPAINAEYAYFLRAMPAERSYHPELVGKGVDKEHSHTRESFRRASWALAMAGGYFVAGFGTTYFGGWREVGPFDVDAPQNDPAENDLQNIRRLFTRLEWWRLQVMDNLVRGDTGFADCLAELDSIFVVYSEENGQVTLTPEGAADAVYSAHCYDPRTGAYQRLPDAIGNAPLTWNPPDHGDWVLVLRRQSA